MTTQTLRGLATHGGMHWRGDRVDGFFGTDPCTRADRRALQRGPLVPQLHRRVRGPGREGRHDHAGADAAVHGLRRCRSCCRRTRCASLDNSLDRGSERAAQTSSTAATTDTVDDLQRLPHPESRPGLLRHRTGEQSFEGEPQNVKVPHLRNVYTKVGMFGCPATPRTATRCAASASCTTAASTR